MPTTSIDSILICGHGLAFEMGLAALANNLPSSINIRALEIPAVPDHDAFYGNVTWPLAYAFHLSLGLDEPGILKHTNTSFSYGTEYRNWAGGLNWSQVHHLPLPIWENIQFHHYLRKFDKPLEPYLVNAVAGHAKKFAHPPSDRSIALSRAEYGYQFQPQYLVKYFKHQSTPPNVTRIVGETSGVTIDDGKIASVETKNGESLTADLFIDCSGTSGKLISSLENTYSFERELGCVESIVMSETPMSSLRELEGQDYGWRSTTHLQDQKSVTTVYHPDHHTDALSAHYGDVCNEFTIPVGRRQKGWSGNCVTIGHANSVIEPLTPAPMMMLQLDIQRLLSLIPVSMDMSVEEKEFNRLLENDYKHCAIFNAAFFNIPQSPNTAYWDSAKSTGTYDELTRKITQFRSRGHLTIFDYEPFNEEDWTILYCGLGLLADRYDQSIDNVSKSSVRDKLHQVQFDIEQIVKKMPPHERYINSFLNYLERKHGR